MRKKRLGREKEMPVCGVHQNCSRYRLYAFRNVATFRILIGGGDGTFGWVLSAVEEMREHLQCRFPPSAVLPLGTGEGGREGIN